MPLCIHHGRKILAGLKLAAPPGMHERGPRVERGGDPHGRQLGLGLSNGVQPAVGLLAGDVTYIEVFGGDEEGDVVNPGLLAKLE